jgi:hypothetical protein
MTTEHYVGLMDLARMLGVGYWRVLYAHRKGALPWPGRVVNTMAYAPDDVVRARAYYAERQKPRRSV